MRNFVTKLLIKCYQNDKMKGDNTDNDHSTNVTENNYIQNFGRKRSHLQGTA